MPKPRKPKVTVSDIPKKSKIVRLPPFDREFIKKIEDAAIGKTERDRRSELERRMFRQDI